MPVITENPRDSFALRKRTLSLHCRAEGEPPPLILWYRDGRPVESFRDKPGTSNKVIKAEELIFLSFDEEDEGVYYCNASNSEGWSKSREARVSLSFLEPITSGPESQTSSVGDTVVLRCEIPKGLPEPIIEWYHNRQLVNYSSRIFISNGSLHIKSLQKTDAGNYQCLARNWAERRESLTAVLTVYKKPWFEVAPSDQQVKVGEDVEFHCIADGDPKPSILWRRDGGLYIPDDRAILKDGRNLRILQVRREDEGIYVCKAENLVGGIDASAKLSVLSSPNFTLTPKDTTVLEGEKAVFHCQATGLPVPFIRWLHNGEYFLVPDYMSASFPEVGRIYVTHNGSLVISAARKSDEGKYECRASQKNGMVRSSANLLVNDFNSLPIVLIELGPQNQTFLYGTTATLHCKARVLESLNLANSNMENFPRTSYGVSISWLRDGKSFVPVDDPRVVMISQDTLQINEVNFFDEGNYTCRAEASPTSHSQSPLKFAEWTAYLKVSRPPLQPPQLSFVPESLPHPPETFDVIDVGDSWISVRCEVSMDSANDIDMFGSKASPLAPRTPPNAKSSVSVRIEYLALDGSHGWLIAAVGEPNELIEITGLQPENGYRMLARVVNSHGVSKSLILPHTIYTRRRVRYVDLDYQVLQDNVQSVRFSKLRLTSLSTSEVEVSGMVCSLSTSVQQLTGIRFGYKSVHLSRCLPKRFNTLHNHLPVSVGGSTSPDNDCMDSDERTFLPEMKAFSLPEYMESVVDNYCSLNVPPDQDAFWELSDDLTQENPVPADKSKFMEWNSNSASSFRQVIDGLSPFHCYEVVAQAYSDHQHLGRVYGSSSRSSTILTFDSKPSEAPQNVRARWTGGNATVLEVMWRPPSASSANGLITGYLLRIFEGATNFSKTFKVDRKTTSYQIEDLPAKNNFTLHLAARTCHGEGVRSKPLHIIASSYLQLMGKNASDFMTLPSPSSRHQPGFGTRFTAAQFLAKDPNVGLDHADLSRYADSGDGAVVPNRHWAQQAWFIGCLISLLAIWTVLCIIVLIMCKRRRRVKQRGGVIGELHEAVDVKASNGSAPSNSDFSRFKNKKGSHDQKYTSSKVGLLQSNDSLPIKIPQMTGGKSANQATTDYVLSSPPSAPLTQVGDPVPYTAVRGLSERRGDGGDKENRHDSPDTLLHTMPRRQRGSRCSDPAEAPATFSNVNDLIEEAGYEAPAMSNSADVPPLQENSKFTSTGSIFLATGRSTSSSSNGSSLHKGAGEARIDDPSVLDDANAVTPYASASLIEQLRCQGHSSQPGRRDNPAERGGGAGPGGILLPFGGVIPPPPQYPPPPAPESPPPSTINSDSAAVAYKPPPPAAAGGVGMALYQGDACHYAQSDLQKVGGQEPQPHLRHYQQQQQPQYIMQQQEPHFVGLRHLPQTYATSRPDDDLKIPGGAARPQGAYLPVCNGPLYPAQEYWPGGTADPASGCVMPNVTTLPNRGGGFYMPHVLSSGGPLHAASGPSQNGRLFMPQPTATLRALQPQKHLATGVDDCAGQRFMSLNGVTSGDPSRTVMMLNGGFSSAIADDVILPPTCSTLAMNSNHHGQVVHPEK
ncbi:Roundabout 1 [Sparganum proliferum]